MFCAPEPAPVTLQLTIPISIWVAVLFVPLPFFGGCAPPGGAAPTLPDSTFVSALVELHLADASAFAENRAPAVTVQDSVLDVLDISPSAYDQTMAWHVEHPEALVSIYNQVLDRLNRMDLPRTTP